MANKQNLKKEKELGLMDAVVKSYLKTGELKMTAEEFHLSPLKVRKLLITAGAYSTKLSAQVNQLWEQGKTVEQIQEITGLKKSSVNGYLPYTKVIYKSDQLSSNAERLRIFRQRESSVEKLQNHMCEEVLWETLLLFQNYPFYTAKGLCFQYTIKGNELFFSRKAKSVTRSTVNMAMQTAMDLQNAGILVKGPKQLRCFGASYLYPVFIRLKIIRNG
jgi:hypothetical protein